MNYKIYQILDALLDGVPGTIQMWMQYNPRWLLKINLDRSKFIINIEFNTQQCAAAKTREGQ
eukprot:SAG31_NODE_1625_length_7716_cov_23.849941_11_plen_62_part_00